jgi:hypothetical protein
MHQIRGLPCTKGPILQHLTCVYLFDGRLDIVAREMNSKVLQEGSVEQAGT